jgi:enoyl-CoA hydratase/carnithine racemase
MTYQHILFEVRDKIAWIAFNRQDQLNAMNARMMNEIIYALKEINAADSKMLRVAVIIGLGKAFMAGADIKEYAKQTQAEFEDFQSRGHSLYEAIEGNSKPVIAAVNGYAFGGGFEIALACDLILAVEGAKMGLPEILLNLIPGGGGAIRLARKIGINLANEMIMTGRTVLAEEMQREGLINYIYPKESFMEKVTEFASSLVNKEPDRLQAIKQITQLAAGGAATTAHNLEQTALNTFYRSAEGQEKIHEFYKKSLEKKR